MRKVVSHTFVTISAATRSVARCGARLEGSLSVPTTIASSGASDTSAASTSAAGMAAILVCHS